MHQLLKVGISTLLLAFMVSTNAVQAELEAAKSNRLPSVSATAGITQFDDAPAFDFSAAGVPAVLPLFGGDSIFVPTVRWPSPTATEKA